MNKVPTESEEAKALVAYMRLRNLKFVHIPNETGSSHEARRRAIRVKRGGGAKGFPDYLVWVGGQMLAIELKRIKGSNSSPEQRQWIDFLNGVGTPAKICKGWVEAKAFIEEVENDQRRQTIAEYCAE